MNKERELREAIKLIKSLINVNSSQYPHYRKLLLNFELELDKINEEKEGKKKRKEKNNVKG